MGKEHISERRAAHSCTFPDHWKRANEYAEETFVARIKGRSFLKGIKISFN